MFTHDFSFRSTVCFSSSHILQSIFCCCSICRYLIAIQSTHQIQCKVGFGFTKRIPAVSVSVSLFPLGHLFLLPFLYLSFFLELDVPLWSSPSTFILLTKLPAPHLLSGTYPILSLWSKVIPKSFFQKNVMLLYIYPHINLEFVICPFSAFSHCFSHLSR